jgi:hypothetical protein
MKMMKKIIMRKRNHSPARLILMKKKSSLLTQVIFNNDFVGIRKKQMSTNICKNDNYEKSDDKPNL